MSREFENLYFEKNKKYLLKYFKTKKQKQILKYFLTFNSFENYTDHTGDKSDKQWLRFLFNRFEYLEKIHLEAKQSINLELLVEIESGKIRKFCD